MKNYNGEIVPEDYIAYFMGGYDLEATTNLYGLTMQYKYGDVPYEQPNMMKVYDRLLYDAWYEQLGKNKSVALGEFFEAVEPFLQEKEIDLTNEIEIEAKSNFTACMEFRNATGLYSMREYLYDYEQFYREHMKVVLND